MRTILFLETFSQAWRDVQVAPIRTVCPCALSSGTAACTRRPRARARRRSRSRHAVRGRSSDPGASDRGPEPGPRTVKSRPKRVVAGGSCHGR